MPDRLSNLNHPLCSRAVFSIKEVGIIANLSERGVYKKFEADRMKWVWHDGKRLVEREELIRYLDVQPFIANPDKGRDPLVKRVKLYPAADVLKSARDGTELEGATS